MKAHRFSGSRRTAAFTLLEVMIAMTLLVCLLTAVYASWSSVVNSSRIGLKAAARVQRSRVAIRAMVDALLTVQMFGANSSFYAFEADTSGDYANVSFVSRLPASFLDAGLFGQQIVRRVTFAVEPGREGNQLVMYQMPYLAKENAEQKPFPIVLAKDVNLFTMDFWDGKHPKWLTSWDNTNSLPKLVRISLGVGKQNRYNPQADEVYTRIVALPSMVIPREFQMPGPAPRTNGPGQFPSGPSPTPGTGTTTPGTGVTFQ